MISLKSGDCLDVLKELESNSVDALLTDPPAGISFMGKAWDHNKGGRDQWIAWLTEVMSEVMRVLKPGAHGLVWAIPRTSHWTATALENAGFEVRDVVTHLFGSGFPKSLDISKAIDKAAGAEREVIGLKHDAAKRSRTFVSEEWQRPALHDKEAILRNMQITAPSTHEAEQWQGFGTALKPASEHWVLVRKPISEKTVAANVLKWSTGGLNIDQSRIEGSPRNPGFVNPSESDRDMMATSNTKLIGYKSPSGRFPANLVLSHNADCVMLEIEQVKSLDKSFYEPGGINTSETWECTEGCAVKELDGQSGDSKSTGGQAVNRSGKWDANGMTTSSVEKRDPGFGDTGGASRFFYCAKPSKRERNAGLEGLVNAHPTVKSLKLMQYLITMITPPGGTIIDPFMGSGSTGVAAKKAGFGFIGIERETDYLEIAQKRIDHAEETSADLPLCL